MTARGNEILEFIRDFAVREGYLPTFDEIGNGVGISSKATIFCHVARLEGEGYIERIGRRYRVKGLKYVREDI